MQFANICLCAATERLPRLVRSKVAMIRAFTVDFQKASKSCLLFLAAFPSLIDTPCTDVSLKVPAMIVYDVAINLLGT